MTFEMLHTSYLQQREKITKNYSNPILVSNLCIVQAKRILQEFYHLFKLTSFKDQAEEIHFFKTTKHTPFTDLIYYHELKAFEVSKLHRSQKDQFKITNRKDQKLNQYFLQHIDFGLYIESKQTDLDAYYFTVKPLNALHPNMTNPFMIDPGFSTPKDFEYAEFKAKLKLKTYIKQLPQHRPKNLAASTTLNKHLKWTRNKVDLIELIYALHASDSLKDGTAVKELAKVCEEVFNVDLGNYYRKFIELRNRKLVERTRFIDTLKSSLIKRMEDADD